MIDCQLDEKSIFNLARNIESPEARAEYLVAVRKIVSRGFFGRERWPNEG
jgi:hypothetical protein